jgi:zinc transporter ZupT
LDRRVIRIAIWTGVAAMIGVVIANVLQITGYWPHLVVALAAAAGAIIVSLSYRRA